jgi:hypothetical protein
MPALSPRLQWLMSCALFVGLLLALLLGAVLQQAPS